MHRILVGKYSRRIFGCLRQRIEANVYVLQRNIFVAEVFFGKLEHWTKKWIYIKFAQRKYDGKLCLLQSKPVANAVNAIFGTIFTIVQIW